MKPTLKKIVSQGFRFSGNRAKGLEIYGLGYARIIYNPVHDTVEDEFSADDKFEDEQIKLTPHGY